MQAQSLSFVYECNCMQQRFNCIYPKSAKCMEEQHRKSLLVDLQIAEAIVEVPCGLRFTFSNVDPLIFIWEAISVCH